MTDEPPTQDNRPTGPAAALGDLRQIRRSDDSMVAGVLSGVGRFFGIDPVILRVVTAVLAIFGGVGVLIYALGWLLLPRENAPSLLDEARGHAVQRAPGAVPLAIGLGVVVVIFGSRVVFGSWEPTVLALLVAAGLYALLQRRGAESHQNTQAHQNPSPRVPDAAPESAWEPTRPTVEPYEPGTTFDPAPAAAPTAQGRTTGWPEGPDWAPPSSSDRPEPPAWGNGATMPPEQPAATGSELSAPRSRLSAITLSLAGLAAAVVFINDITWAEMPPGMYAAAPLAVVALGLLLGMRGRRTKWLIAAGIAMSILLVPLTFLGQFTGETINERPTTLADVDGLVVDQPVGDVNYDLSAVPFTDGDTAHMVVNQGVGELSITLPPEVDATIRYSGGVGETSILDRHFEGFIEGRTFTDQGPDGEGGGSITLNVTLGVGDVEVTR